MDSPAALVFPVLVACFALSVVARQLVVRRLRRRFAWVLFSPALVIAVFTLWTAVVTIDGMPVVGVPFAIGALFFFVVVMRSVVRFHRGAQTLTSQDQLVNAGFDALAEATLVGTVLALIGALIAGAALIVSAIAQRAHL